MVSKLGIWELRLHFLPLIALAMKLCLKHACQKSEECIFFSHVLKHMYISTQPFSKTKQDRFDWLKISFKSSEWYSNASEFDQESHASQSLAYWEKFYLIKYKHHRDTSVYFLAEMISISCQLGGALF